MMRSTRIWHGNFRIGSTLFICMNRNGELCAHNDETMIKMRRKNIPCKQVSSNPLPLTAEFFYEKGTDLTLKESVAAFVALKKEGLIWPKSCILLKDPSLTRYTDVYIQVLSAAVPRVVPRLDSLKGTESPLLQALKMAWGFREVTSEHSLEIYDWFRNHGIRP